MNTCVDECECNWEDENDECWEGCIACWDPMGCGESSDWGQDEEWATESDALDCWIHTNPCADACDGLVAPSDDCLGCMDANGYFRDMIKAPQTLFKSLNKFVLIK